MDSNRNLSDAFLLISSKETLKLFHEEIQKYAKNYMIDKPEEPNYKPITIGDIKNAIDNIGEPISNIDADEAWTKKGDDNMAVLLPMEKPKISLEHPEFLKPHRLDGETDHQYKARRVIQKLYIKQRKRGSLAWIAKDLALPQYAEDDTEKKKPIGYKESEGFTYNKAKFEKAIKEWQAKQELK